MKLGIRMGALRREAFACGLVLLGLWMNCQGQRETDLPNQLGTALGIYKINFLARDEPGFEEFDYFRMRKFPGQDAHASKVEVGVLVSVDGFLVTKSGTTFKFQKASFKRRPTGEFESMQFTTEKVGGITYSFTGAFLEETVQEERGGNFTKVRGALTRCSDGVTTTSRTLPFFEYAEL